LPAFEFALPPGAKNIKIKTGTQEIAVEPTYYRHSKDGAIPIVALFGGDEFVGEVLEGQWKKNIWQDGMGKLRIHNGKLELEVGSDSDGTTRYGRIYSKNKVLFVNGVEITVQMSVPVSSSSQLFNNVFILGDDEFGAGSNNIKLAVWVDSGGVKFLIIRRVNGTWITEYSSDYTTDTEAEFKIRLSDGTVYVYTKEGSATSFTLRWSGDNWLPSLLWPQYYPDSKSTTKHILTSDFVRVSYPDFSIKYDLDDSDYQNGNRGEVVVWDTMGSSDEDDWVRVYDPSHKFVGDLVLENGLVRFWFKEDQYLRLYLWDGSSWKYIGYLNHYDGSTNDSSPSEVTLTSVSLESVSVSFKLNSLSHSFTLRRGKPYGEFEITFPQGITDGWFRIVNTGTRTDFGYAPESKIMDRVLGIRGDTDDTPADNFALQFDRDENVLVFFGMNKQDNMVNNIASELGCKGFSFASVKAVFGAIPFSKVGNLFKEAEA